jgi:hypothetical protein
MAQSSPRQEFLRELRLMAPVSAGISVLVATVRWLNGDSFWLTLAGCAAVFVFLLPLMWARWFLTGSQLLTRRGLITFAVCVVWVAVGVGIGVLMS